MVVGAPGALNAETGGSTGAVYVMGLFGSQYSTAYLDDSSIGFTGFGGSDGDEAGAAIAGVDLNGDELGELLVGAPSAANSAGEDDAGVIYLLETDALFTTSWRRDATLTDVAAARWEGERAGHQAGQQLIDAGDLNGDGEQDIAIGAPSFGQESGQATGAVYILYGPIESGVHELADADARVLGEWSDEGVGGQLGHSLAGAEDLDGDGLDDLALGVPFQGNGVTWILYGGGL